MGVSFAARKHPVLTTLRDKKAQVTPVGEVALSIPSGQPGRERGGNGLPKKPAPGRDQHRMKGRSVTKRAIPFRARQNGRARAVWCPSRLLASYKAYTRPDRQLLGLPISPKLPPVFDPSCMRQKLVSRTVRRPSPTPAAAGLDHLHGPTSHSICGNLMIYKPSLTNDRLMFEHDESLRADLLLINFPASYENGKLEHFLHRCMKNRENKNFWFTMFPEKRYFRETTSTTEVAIHTNLFTDLYASIGTGSSRTGGWYTTIMKLPFIFFIRIGFLLASSGGSRSLLRQLQKDKLRWHRESSVEFIIA
ncbi:hypothetical protein ACFE04_019629 [Oxalis oulophora]